MDANNMYVLEQVQTWRHQVIRGILRTLVVVATLAIVLPLYYSYEIQEFWRVPVLLGAYALVVLITFWPRTPYSIQGSALLTLIYLLSIYNLVLDAQTGDGFLFMMAFPFLTTLLFGQRPGRMALVIATLTLVIFGWAFVSGRIVPRDQAIALQAGHAASWLARIIVFFMLNLLLMLPSNYLFRRLVTTLTHSHNLTQELKREVAERVRAERVLRDSTEKIRGMFESITDGITFTDLQGRIVDMNQATVCMHDYQSKEELIGRSAFDLIADHEHARASQSLQETLVKGRTGVIEYKFVTKDGNEFDAELTAVLLKDEQQSPSGFVALTRDITERKQAEVERENLIRELEAKNAELERFTYTVSHDLKSPLVTIGSFVGFVEKDAQAGDMDRLKADVNRIREAADQMERLLEELLELSRIGRLVNPPESVPFETIVGEALELVHGRLVGHGVTVEVAANLPVVYGDRVRMVEVVQNLVDNAAKFMGDQPQPRIEIGMKEQDGEPVFFVQDNGLGIKPQYHQKVFGLFEKLDPQSEGTGIGLALVKRIVEVHGGRIWIESDGLGQGATFCFTLPQPNV